MAAAYASLHEERVKKLILLAPALHLDSYGPYLGKKLHMPVIIFHGLQDDVVPPAAVRAIAQQQFLRCAFHSVDDDHSLHRTFAGQDWDALLEIDPASRLL
jgi:predicted esterase